MPVADEGRAGVSPRSKAKCLAVGGTKRTRSRFNKIHAFPACRTCRATAQLRSPHRKFINFLESEVLRSFCNQIFEQEKIEAEVNPMY